MHVHQPTLHVIRRDEGDVLDSNGVEDVFLEVRVQGQVGRALHEQPCPVNVYTVLELGARLVDQRQAKDVAWVAGKLIDTDGSGPVPDFDIVEDVAKPSL